MGPRPRAGPPGRIYVASDATIFRFSGQPRHERPTIAAALAASGPPPHKNLTAGVESYLHTPPLK